MTFTHIDPPLFSFTLRALRQVVSPDTVVEQEARPTGCMWYPYCGGKGDNQKVLTMNDEYKFKIWNTVTWFFSNDAAGFFSFFPQKERVCFSSSERSDFFVFKHHPKQKQPNGLRSYSWIGFERIFVVCFQVLLSSQDRNFIATREVPLIHPMMIRSTDTVPDGVITWYVHIHM